MVTKAAHDIEAHAKASILSGAKTGKVYPSGHQASAPGESPANEFGILAAGIGVIDGAGPLEKRVVSAAAYTRGLELGTTKVAARPFMNPALESVRGSFVAAVEFVVSRG